MAVNVSYLGLHLRCREAKFPKMRLRNAEVALRNNKPSLSESHKGGTQSFILM